MYQAKQELLAQTARLLMSRHCKEIELLKQNENDLQREDFVWHYLLQSFATMGRSSGWHGLIGNTENYEKLRYELLKEVKDPMLRLRHVKIICHQAKVRMPDKKAGFIYRCFDYIEEMGGYVEAKNRLLQCNGRDEKIKFLRTFPGIGEKYSRNIMMDVYHPDFRESIAVDQRINSILRLLGIELRRYVEKENFLLGSARLAGLSGWELDRLMYGNLKEFSMELKLGRLHPA